VAAIWGRGSILEPLSPLPAGVHGNLRGHDLPSTLRDLIAYSIILLILTFGLTASSVNRTVHG